ncbi:MAG: ATP-binding cassette domain-containing protein [candidate division WOR-3 bacterium]
MSDHRVSDSSLAIELEGVSKLYHNSWPALTDVSLRVGRGDFVFVLGATGAGKTTLLRLLYRAELPDSGKISVLGYDLGNISKREIPALRRRIGVIFQDFKLLAGRTTYENLEFVLRSIGMKEEQIPARIQETLIQLGLTHRRDAYPHELSGGEQQKVSIARALVKEPELLLADEPTGNIDPKGAADILNLLKDANYRGATVVMCTHNSELALGSHRRCVTLDAGRIVRDVG